MSSSSSSSLLMFAGLGVAAYVLYEMFIKPTGSTAPTPVSPAPVGSQPTPTTGLPTGGGTQTTADQWTDSYGATCAMSSRMTANGLTYCPASASKIPQNQPPIIPPVTHAPPPSHPTETSAALATHMLALNNGNPKATLDEWNFYEAAINGDVPPAPEDFLPEGSDRNAQYSLSQYLSMRGLRGLSGFGWDGFASMPSDRIIAPFSGLGVWSKRIQ